MPQPKLRRILAFTALLAALSMLPAQAAGGPAQVRERLGFSARVERIERAAWNFLAGLFEKKTSSLGPDGLLSSTTGDGGH
jgi:hypothetical protein